MPILSAQKNAVAERILVVFTFTYYQVTLDIISLYVDIISWMKEIKVNVDTGEVKLLNLHFI